MNPLDEFQDEELSAAGPTDPMAEWLARYKSGQATPQAPAPVSRRMPSPPSAPSFVGAGLEKGGPIEDPSTMAFLSQYGQDIIPRGSDDLTKMREAGPGPTHVLSNMDLLRQATLEKPQFDVNSITADAPVPPAPVGAPAAGGGKRSITSSSAAPDSATAAPPNMVFDVGAGKLGRDADLKDAQNRAANVKFVNEMGKAGDIIGAGISGGQPIAAAQSLFDSNIKDADNIVQDYQARVANQKNDPDSPYSKAFREYAKQLGIDIRGDFTAADGEKIAPMLYKQYEQAAEQKYKNATLGLKRDELSETSRHHKAMEGISKDKATSTGGKATDSQVAKLRGESTKGQLGKLYENLKLADSASAAIDEFAKNPSGYTDYGTLMLALKTLQGDTSVVKEAEMRMGRNAASLFTKAQNYVDRAANGESLQPKQRQEILKALKGLQGIRRDQYAKAARPIYEQAKRQNLPMNEVFSDPSIFGGDAPATKEKASAAPEEKMVGKTKYRKVPGGWEEVH